MRWIRSWNWAELHHAAGHAAHATHAAHSCHVHAAHSSHATARGHGDGRRRLLLLRQESR